MKLRNLLAALLVLLSSAASADPQIVFKCAYGFTCPLVNGYTGGIDPLDVVKGQLNQNFSTLFGTANWVEIGAGITYSALATTSPSNSIPIYTVPAGSVIRAVTVQPVTAFLGGSISSYYVTVGTSANPVLFTSRVDVGQVSPATLRLEQVTISSATPVMLSAEIFGDNLNAATQGVLNVWALITPAQ